LGLLTELLVHEASVQDRQGARPLLLRVVARIRTILRVFFDSAYQGELLCWMEETLGLVGEVVRAAGQGMEGQSETDSPLSMANNASFPILPFRWVVERTLAWLCRYRRLSKDYEASIEVSEAMVWFASLRTLTRRLADAT
jgi:putative transposase